MAARDLEEEADKHRHVGSVVLGNLGSAVLLSSGVDTRASIPLPHILPLNTNLLDYALMAKAGMT